MMLVPRLLAALALAGSIPAQAADPVVGQYWLAAGPETATELQLRADGKFADALEEGALDEFAEGR